MTISYRQTRKFRFLAGTALWVLTMAPMALAQHDFMPAPPKPPTITPPSVYAPPKLPSAPAPKTPAPAVQAPQPKAAPSTKPASPAAAPQPDSPERIALRGLQQSLAAAGFDPGPADGLIGNRTRSALDEWIGSLEDETHADKARAALQAEDFAALAALISNPPVPPASPVVTETLQLAAPASGGPSGSSGAGSGAGGDGGSPEGGGGDGGGLPAESDEGMLNRKAPKLQPDADLVRLLARYDEQAKQMSPEALAKEVQGVAMLTLDEPTTAILDADLTVRLAEGSGGYNSFYDRKKALEQERDRLLESFEYSDQMARLEEARANYYIALGNEQIVADRSFTQANERVAKAVKNSEALLADSKSRQPQLVAALTEAITKGYSESWTNLKRSSVEFNQRNITERLPAQILRQRSTEYFNQTLATTSIEYGGTPYSFGGAPRFNADGELINKESDRFLADIETHFTNLQNERQALEDWKLRVEALQDDVLTFRNTVVSGGQTEEDIAKLQGDLRDTMQDPVEDVLNTLTELEEPVEIAKPTPETPPGPDTNPDDPGPAPEEYLANADDPNADRDSLLARKQSEITQTYESIDRARAEMESIAKRTDIAAEEKAQIIEGLKARIAALEGFAKSDQATLAALGGSYDATDRKDVSGFDPYKLTETDIELARSAEHQKASERFYEELALARETIRDTAEGLDAITLQDRVTTLSERLAKNADDINTLAEDLHSYATNIRLTREQGELEYLAAMAEDAVLAAESNLAYTQSILQTSKNANLLLLMGAAGGATFGVGGVTAAQAAAAQGVLASMEGATGAIEGYSTGGILEGVTKGGAEAGKYYLPINTALSLSRDEGAGTVALGILADAAVLFTGYKAAQTYLDKATAAQAAVTRQALTPAEQAVSQAARQAVDKADDLIGSYQQTKWTAQQARATGLADEAAEASLQRLVKAIDRSDEAKLALKARDPKLQYQFITDQAEIIKDPAKLAFEANMRALGWSDEAIKTGSIRNASSAGTVGLDDDIRLLEPSVLDMLDDQKTLRWTGPQDPDLLAAKAEFKAGFTQNGKSGSLVQWEADAKAAMDKAYLDTVGYSAAEARINMTTSTNLEAYADVELLLGQGGSAGWAEQTAAVTQTKIREGIKAAVAMGLGNSPPASSLSGIGLEHAATEAKVAARELIKDLAGKAMRARPDVVLSDNTQKQLRIIGGLAKGIHDPAVANRLLLEQTGTTLSRTLETLGGQVEVLLKFD